MKQLKAGRPIDLKSIERVRDYLKIGLKQSEIARIMKKDPTQVLRWVRYIESKKAKVDA